MNCCVGHTMYLLMQHLRDAVDVCRLIKAPCLDLRTFHIGQTKLCPCAQVMEYSSCHDKLLIHSYFCPSTFNLMRI